MKSKIGMIGGFLFGAIGFMLLFKVIILDHTAPEDELAPGMVVILAIVTGATCGFIGNRVQNFFGREKTP